MQKILFPYTKDTFCGSLDTEPVSCICIADPNLMYRAQPGLLLTPLPRIQKERLNPPQSKVSWYCKLANGQSFYWCLENQSHWPS